VRHHYLISNKYRIPPNSNDAETNKYNRIRCIINKSNDQTLNPLEVQLEVIHLLNLSGSFWNCFVDRPCEGNQSQKSVDVPSYDSLSSCPSAGVISVVGGAPSTPEKAPNPKFPDFAISSFICCSVSIALLKGTNNTKTEVDMTHEACPTQTSPFQAFPNAEENIRFANFLCSRGTNDLKEKNEVQELVADLFFVISFKFTILLDMKNLQCALDNYNGNKDFIKCPNLPRFLAILR